MEVLKTEPKLKKVSLRGVVHRTSTTTGIIAGAGIIVLVFLTLMEVVKRYFLNSPTSWVLEISELLIAFGAFLGMAYALQVGAHVSVNIIYRRYSKRGRRIADLTGAVLTLFLWAGLAWYALQKSLVYLERNVRSETLLAVPQFYPMMLVFLGSLFCCFCALAMAYYAVASLTGKDFRHNGDGGKVATPNHRGAEE